MGFQFERGRYSLLPSAFVWGFETEQSGQMTLSKTDDPHIQFGRTLQAAIARVGWDIENLDVVVEVAQARNGACFRFVSEISGMSNAIPFTMLYRISPEDAADGIASNELVKISFGTKSIYLDGPIGDDDLKTVNDLSHEVLDGLARLPSAALSSNGDRVIEQLCETPKIPAPHISPTLYCWLPLYQWEPRHDDVVLAAGERRLLPYGIAGPEHKSLLHPRAHCDFNFATVNPAKRGTNGLHEPLFESLPVEISLKALNDVFVIDAARSADLERSYREIAERLGRTHPTEYEFSDFKTATARTMTPVNEYAGGFESPVYLIGRQLNSNEARRITGNVDVSYDGTTLKTSIIDAVKGRKIPVTETIYPTLADMETALSLANTLTSAMHTDKIVSDKLLFEMTALQQKRYTSYLEHKVRTGERSEIMDIMMKPALW